MKLRSLLAVAFVVVGVSGGAVACSTETIVQQAGPPDGGEPEGGKGEAGLRTCMPGVSVDCTCASGAAGKADCAEDGTPSVCSCGTTSLDQHTVISKSSKSALEVETSLAAAPDGAMVSVWISL